MTAFRLCVAFEGFAGAADDLIAMLDPVSLNDAAK
jgi:hypothetical protein